MQNQTIQNHTIHGQHYSADAASETSVLVRVNLAGNGRGSRKSVLYMRAAPSTTSGSSSGLHAPVKLNGLDMMTTQSQAVLLL